MYTYEPLSRQKAEIRLLRLAAPSHTHASTATNCPQLAFELRHFSLTADPVQYAALSYVWGNVDKQNMIDIKVNGEAFPVSDVMYVKLQGLFQTMANHGVETMSCSWIWVDYICINQSDPVEKSWQVAQMRDIYSLADRVYMLLGPGNPDSDRAMSFVSEVGPRAVAAQGLDRSARHRASRRLGKLVQLLASNSAPPAAVQSDLTWICYELLQDPRLYPPQSGTTTPATNTVSGPGKERTGDVGFGLEDILLRDYWHRVWIVQEVVSATNALVVCGSHIVTLDSLEATISCLTTSMDAARAGYGQPFDLFMRTREGTPKILHGPMTTLALSTRRARRENEDGGGWMTRLACLLYKRSPAVGRPYYSASDPRDMVFALLGVTSDKERLGLEIDYRLSSAQVLTAATRALIHDAEIYSDQPFHLDCCVPRRRGDNDSWEGGNMPSWVPDWEHIGRHGVSIWRINHQRRFNATNGMPLDPALAEHDTMARKDSFSDKTFILRRSGCHVDHITEVMPPPQYDSPDPRLPTSMVDVDGWFRSIVEFTRLPPHETGEAEDYVWRTVRCDTKGKRGILEGQDPARIATEAKLHVIRQVMRRRPLIPSSLSKAEAEAVRCGIYPYPSKYAELNTLEKQCTHLFEHWPRKVATTARGRTLFKTAKGMLGMGHDAVRVGDAVALLAGLKVPVVLRPEEQEITGRKEEEEEEDHREEEEEQEENNDYYSFLGDAYVDGIMHGEFLETLPAQRIFDIV